MGAVPVGVSGGEAGLARRGKGDEALAEVGAGSESDPTVFLQQAEVAGEGGLVHAEEVAQFLLWAMGHGFDGAQEGVLSGFELRGAELGVVGVAEEPRDAPDGGADAGQD